MKFIKRFMTFCCFLAKFLVSSLTIYRLATPEEKAFITEGKGKTTAQGTPDVPYRQLLLDTTVWATWFANLAFFSSLLVFLQYGPLYMNKVCLVRCSLNDQQTFTGSRIFCSSDRVFRWFGSRVLFGC